mmetsp:Transcript_6383/g.10459  ORF Transcript_6383/g.10459 Transcript_6383/m.10459 type:complete len:440 (+) Transcript_6383:50-1369(+)
MTTSFQRLPMSRSFEPSLFTRKSCRIAPDRVVRTNNYRRLLLNRKGKIDCKVLYRTIMRLEKPLRRSRTLRHRFIRLLYQAACDPSIDYNTINSWLKTNYHVFITVVEVRQLVLYSGLFGDTGAVSPPNATVRYVLKHCVMSVPRLHLFKRWCVDVKRLQSSPDSKEVAKGYFAPANRDDETCTIQSLIDDFQAYDNMDSSDDEEEVGDDHSTESVEDPQMTPGDKLRRGIRNVMKMNLFGGIVDNMKKKGSEEKQYVRQRKGGAANVYTLDANKPEFNKFIAELNKGNATPDVKTLSMPKEMTDADVNFSQRQRCTDTLIVKRAMNTPALKIGDSEPGVDVEVIMDIIKELHEAEINPDKVPIKGRKASRSASGGGGQRKSVVVPKMRQSMAMLSFKQQMRNANKMRSKFSSIESEARQESHSDSDDSFDDRGVIQWG